MSTNERRYYDALKRIASFMTPEQLQRKAEKQYGLSFSDALQFAYENVLAEATAAIKGKRRPSEAASENQPKRADLIDKEQAP